VDGSICRSTEGVDVKKKFVLFLMAGAAMLVAGRHCAHVMRGEAECHCAGFMRSKDRDEPMAA
jgi:hypothetical protein